MINSIIAFSIRNKLLVGLFTLSIIFGGLWSITQVPIDAVPDITNNQVQIITQSPTLATEDIEQFVTYPLELAMANLPGVVEIRSVSRFGLSLVTLVFEDDMGVYLPRQLVAEKLASVKNDIPSSIGVPEIGPISTGLSEIYQYTLEVDPKFENKYSLTELREIQDWIIRRQMAMLKGVVEINGYGGDVKQYEVVINPDVLKSMSISLLEIFEALEENNENTGAAYIEKSHQAQFIRGEGLIRSIEDIENIVVKTQNGLPITIQNIAKVKLGRNIKYGAFTKNGKGEAVGGMILMLKGANSNEVINAVKERVEEIQKSLPEGIRMEPFLDRSTLISQTTGTVKTNLMEGALIVIFILILLLGNWRGGLIVATTIPLSLLFAFILMNFFGVWANLMSLGAIDFGIIIDGAVIIVESTVFLFYKQAKITPNIKPSKRNKLAGKASRKMMNSAFFGQLIILIVFIPLLALEGIEGKMFKPMALTFMFSMVGVMILCLTYVPMMSAWFIRVSPKAKASIGDKIILWLQNTYEGLINTALKRAKLIIVFALIGVGSSIMVFNRLGGEFIPKLDEGDIAFHTILKPGSSLSESIETTTKIENILLSSFPDEVESVLCRIGVADVPTDPMPMDIADCFLILKPLNQWRKTKNKAELVELFKNEVSKQPGLNFEFTQPIEMRFNELITGVREDVAIKIFGDDLDILASKAEEIGKLIQNIEGVADLKVEATKGLPQITVEYDRNKISQYGVSIQQLNTILKTSFAGAQAGLVYEGERRFDLVLRLEKESRDGIDDLKNLFVNLPNDQQIPLKELALISYTPGPMQISRENTKRRTYVGINVRGRDVKTLILEIQDKLETELELPEGYYLRYGGAFENLQRATFKLQIVLPIALALIFILIFLALGSFKQSIMIYMAIPLAATGGVFSLWLRDMPFSISAGIGFIVLFGIAVLNGLVLISAWNEIKENSNLGLKQRIIQGVKSRIRPIVLTASTDILGFLPMAISNSAGAEVQRPLATVVIGGMITATILTLFVLPILYQWLETRKSRKTGSKRTHALGLLVLAFLLPKASNAQDKVLTSLDQAIELAHENNTLLKVKELQIRAGKNKKKASFNPEKTNVQGQYGQFNSYENDVGISITQKFQFPTSYRKQAQLETKRIEKSQADLRWTNNKLDYEIRMAWVELNYLLAKMELFKPLDSLYEIRVNHALLSYQTEQIGYLELITIQNQQLKMMDDIQILESDISSIKRQLNFYISDSISWEIEPDGFYTPIISMEANISDLSNNADLKQSQSQVEIVEAERKLLNAKAFPEFTLGYMNQTFNGSLLENGQLANSDNRFVGFQVGISIPIFYSSHVSKNQAAKLHIEQAQLSREYKKDQIEKEFEQALANYLKFQKSFNFHHSTLLPNAKKIEKFASIELVNESISNSEYLASRIMATNIQLEFLKTLKLYNQSICEIHRILGQ